MTTDYMHVPAPGSRLDGAQQAAAAAAPPDNCDLAQVMPEEPFFVKVMERAAVFGAGASWVFAGSETTVVRVLPRDDTRARAYIVCSGVGPVYVGTSKDSLASVRANGLPSAGMLPGVFVLPAGVVLPVAHQEAVEITPDGTHACTVSVIAERWSTVPVT